LCTTPREERESGKLATVIFRIGTEWLGLPAAVFQEVAEWRPIRSVPHRRQGNVLGLANVRGEVLVCISLGHFLGLEKLPSRETLRRAYARLLVVHWGGSRLAFPVDEVHGPQRLHPEQLLPSPGTLARALPCYTRSLFRSGQRIIGVLQVETVLEALERSLK
jgi:chemotaxis-related protein WspD